MIYFYAFNKTQMKIFAETKRLMLRELLPTDVEGMFELDSDPEVHKYLGNKPVKSREDVRNVIEFIRKQYVDHGIGRWAVIEKATNNFIGWSGLKYVVKDENNPFNYYDLGYRLIRKYWGKGFATESSIASLNYGFTDLNLEEILGRADVRNIASQSVLLKSGLKYIETTAYKGHEEHNIHWYRVIKNEWLYKGIRD